MLFRSVPWAFVFQRVDVIPRHPAQLYEAIAYLFIFAFVYGLYRGKNIKAEGFLFGLMLVLLFTARFLIEFLKEHQVSFEEGLPFDMGQMLSLPFILCGIFLMFLKRKASFQIRS